ncbi:MAG: sorbosone dehydrogenase family protein [Gemmatimonadota bacterium]
MDRRIAAIGATVAVLVTGYLLRPPVSAAEKSGLECDPDNAGLTVPAGFCALVFADLETARPRHITVRENGDVFVALRGASGGIVALRDTDGDGRADLEERFGADGGTGIGFFDGFLYFAPDDGVVRYPIDPDALTPSGPADVIVSGLPGPRTQHAAKNVTIDSDGTLYVNIGGPSNACQSEPRSPGSPGIDPCPQLETRGGIWTFDARVRDQDQADGERFATGLRNTFALAIGPRGGLWGVQHGRDGVHDLWEALYTVEQQAEIPSEEFVLIERGDDFGWPYCLHDPVIGAKVLAPEYGGDGTEVGRCAAAKLPVIAFPGHWAPMGLAFDRGNDLPERIRGGAFIAFHGSWNRAPLPQGGYNLVFVEFGPAGPTGEWEVFADGFAGDDVSPRGAEHRPAGVAIGPDGSIFVSDDTAGRIFRIVSQGG